MNEKHVKKITQKIINDLSEGGIPPWRKPFSSQLPMNLCSGHVFTGSNAFLLHPMVSTFRPKSLVAV